MRKILSLLLVLAIAFSFCACGGAKNEKNEYIGVWENIGDVSGADSYLYQLKIYKGGTGDRVIMDKGISEPRVLPFSWEINDGVFNMITSDFGGEVKSGFVIEDGILTSVDGKYQLKKIED